jgi:hypothetical protein
VHIPFSCDISFTKKSSIPCPQRYAWIKVYSHMRRIRSKALFYLFKKAEYIQTSFSCALI